MGTILPIIQNVVLLLITMLVGASAVVFHPDNTNVLLSFYKRNHVPKKNKLVFCLLCILVRVYFEDFGDYKNVFIMQNAPLFKVNTT